MRLVLIALVTLTTTGPMSNSDACSREVTPGPEEEPCGYLPPNQRNRQLIYDGNKAEAGQWPWMAHIRKKLVFETFTRDIRCGGAIINQEWILTAAHCTWPSEESSKYCVVVGHNDVSSFQSNEIMENCTPFGQRPIKVIRHPMYNMTAHGPLINKTLTDAQKQIRYHDIALIKMAPMSFATPDVGRICLPSEAVNYHDRTCYVAGWGETETEWRTIDLLHLKSKIWSESDCRTSPKSPYGHFDFVDYFYCFGEPNANICEGDSGGALMCENSDGQFEAVGVASTGNYENCTGPEMQNGEANYFVRVQKFLQWIDETIKANTDTEGDILPDYSPDDLPDFLPDALPENWDSLPGPSWGHTEDME